jgi:hypothetical protein
MKETLLGRFRRRATRNAETADSRPDPASAFQIRSISNAALTEAEIPGEDANWDNWSGIPMFAASFNGYEHWGSFEKCFEVGSLDRTRALCELTLTELRTSLFCMYRSINHDDGYLTADDLPRAQAIIAQIRDRVRRRVID